MTPFAMLAMESLLRSKDSKVKWLWYLPFVAIIALGVTGRALYAEHFIPREVERPFFTQLTTQAEVWLRYAGLWVIPYKQTLYHHVPDISPLSLRGATVWAGFLALIFGSIGAHKFYLGDKQKGVLYLIFFWTYIPFILGVFEAIKIIKMTLVQS